jgi:MFS family permease
VALQLRAHRVETRSDAEVRPLALVWAGWLVLMAGANLATPLYAVYAQRYGFSSLVLTAIFAAYAVVLVPSLLLFGRLSDRFGRRPVLFAGLLVACAGLAVFAAAQSTAWLFVARGLQGLAVGMISGPATAALVEFDAERDAQRPALLAGLAQAGGSGLGPVVCGVLAAWAPAPRHLAFLVFLGLTVVAAIGVLRLPLDERRDREPWRIQRPRVPAEIRGDFARVSLTAALVWAVMAMTLSIVPSYVSKLLKTHDLALLGAVASVGLLSSCVAQVISQRRRLSPRRAEAGGLALLVAGLLGLVVAHSLPVLLAASVAAGLGHGFGFLSAQDELNSIAPQERRGEVTAAFIACIYALVAAAVIASGVLDTRLALTHAVDVVALVLACVSAVTAVWQLRTN